MAQDTQADALAALVADEARDILAADPWLRANGLTVPAATVRRIGERAAEVARAYEAGEYEADDAGVSR